MDEKLINQEVLRDQFVSGGLPRVTMCLFLNDAAVAEQPNIEILSSSRKPTARRRRRGAVVAMRYSVTMTIGKKVTYDRVGVIGKNINFSQANPNGPITVHPEETITVDQRVEIW